jgi:pimeloyl-ACP methyl ester carboxylesterase
MSGRQGHYGCATRAGCGLLCATVLALLASGCSDPSDHFTREDQYGRTYYIDGAGNWGFGMLAVPGGLHRAGYQGRVTYFKWSATLNPALDQVLGRPLARVRARRLAEDITQYLAAFPKNRVNIIALSAGTGVAVWACESLRSPAKVENVILLSSSLSSDYDMREALAHVRGKVFVYCSPNDMILQGPVRVLGTIDGRYGVDPAGLAGLQSPPDSPKIRNIGWSPEDESLGWTGSHTSCVSEDFVAQVLATHVVPRSYASNPPGQPAAEGGVTMAE